MTIVLRRREAGSFSLRLYRLLLRAYPASFRRNYEEPMARLFQDLCRDAYRQLGVLGILRVWLRIGPDWVSSVVKQHLDGGNRDMGKITISTGVLYLLLVVTIVVYGSLAFSTFYTPPAFNARPTGENLLKEDSYLKAYEEASKGEWGQYTWFLQISGFGLALYLGVWTAVLGLRTRHLWLGGAALLAGAFVTVLSLSVLPWVYFPFDQYAVGATWIMGKFPLAAASWLAVTILGRVLGKPSQAAA